MLRVACLAILLSACSRMPPKRIEHPDQCYRTRSEVDWTDSADCRDWKFVAPVFDPGTDGGTR